jgi:hypothetical protein
MRLVNSFAFSLDHSLQGFACRPIGNLEERYALVRSNRLDPSLDSGRRSRGTI